MLTSFTIYDGDARGCDLASLKSKGFVINPYDRRSFLIEIPVGWKLERKGCYRYEITGPEGETVIYSRNLRCILIHS